MAGPFMLLSHAEQTLSGLTGLLVSTAPLVTCVIVRPHDRGALRIGKWRVGRRIGVHWSSVVAATAVALCQHGDAHGVCYRSPFIVAARLRDVPALGSISLARCRRPRLPACRVDGAGGSHRPQHRGAVAPPCCARQSRSSCSPLIAEIGPARAAVHHINPIVALVLGCSARERSPTRCSSAYADLIGCWFAADRQREPLNAPPARWPLPSKT